MEREPEIEVNTTIQRDNNKRSENDSIMQLIKNLADKSTRLMREEFELAKAEMREKAQSYAKSSRNWAIGAVMIFGAFGLFLFALNNVVTVWFATFMAPSLAVWMAPLILAVGVGLIGWSIMSASQHSMKQEGLALNRTAQSLRADKAFFKKEVRNA